jgi:chemotaxis protein histidine kinase CheA
LGNGFIDVESLEGQGTAFLMGLPLLSEAEIHTLELELEKQRELGVVA